MARERKICTLQASAVETAGAGKTKVSLPDNGSRFQGQGRCELSRSGTKHQSYQKGFEAGKGRSEFLA
jgi:hypothetical protein